MALSGTHVVCSYIGSPAARQQVQALLGETVWSETMAVPGTTSQVAPVNAPEFGEPSFEIRATADIYVAVGAAPNASLALGTGDSARFFVPANETRNVFCRANDKLAWVVA